MTRLARLAGLGLSLALLLQACGGGEGASLTPQACTTKVSTGFAGDLNALYGGDGSGGGDGGDGSADGDGGSAGVGGGEGKVLGALVSINRLSDGALLAQALTDTTDGLATVNWCRQDLPVLVTLSGRPGARYYDEATETLLDFPPGVELHALVERFDENIGVSTLTEAAWQYALSGALTGGASADRKQALASKQRLSGEQVRAANGRVLAEVNRLFTDALGLASIRSLPTPLDSGSADSVLPRNRYGRIAALHGGMVQAARGYDFDAPNPALKLAVQLATDLADGRLDGLGLDGRPVAPAGARAFDPQTVSQRWTMGIGQMAARFGRGTVQLDGEDYISEDFLGLNRRLDCEGGSSRVGRYGLTKLGTVTAIVYTPPAGASCLTQSASDRADIDKGFLANIAFMSQQVQSDRLFAVRRNGSVLAWGRSGCGRLGDGSAVDGVVETPKEVAGLGRVVAMVDAGPATLALNAAGQVYSWGMADGGALGQGSGPFDVEGCADERLTGGQLQTVRAGAVLSPRRIAGLAGIKALSGQGAPAALGEDGRVWRWGRMIDESGRAVEQATPLLFGAIDRVAHLASSTDLTFALRRDGSVWGWGANSEGAFGDGSRSVKMPPQQVAGVADAADLAADGFGTTLALRRDGRVQVWGGLLAGGQVVALAPSFGSGFPIYSVWRNGRRELVETPLPRAVRLIHYRGYAGFIGADGRSHYFVNATNAAERRWHRVEQSDLPSPLNN